MVPNPLVPPQGQQSNTHTREQPPHFQLLSAFSQHCPRGQLSEDRSGSCHRPAWLGTRSHMHCTMTDGVRATHGLSRLPDPRLAKFALFLLKGNRPYYTLSVTDSGMFNRRLQILTKGTFSFGSLSLQWLMEITAYTAPACVWLVQLLLGQGEEPPTLLPLQAPHLLAQPYLHVYLGSPCGICWGGGGKTMVSFPQGWANQVQSVWVWLKNPPPFSRYLTPAVPNLYVCPGQWEH